MEKKQKRFRLLAQLINLKTNEHTSVDIIIYGVCGNDAVSKYRSKLSAEGVYKIDDYDYMQLD